MICLVKVSIVIPTFNRAWVIRRSIGSALSQTYRDFEILIVDDGSTDETFDVVKTFFQYPQVRYIRHEKNRGHQAARNTGIKNARGDYIAFLDSDDTWIPEKIELQLEAINKKGADCVVLTGMWLVENGKRTRLRLFERQYEGYVYPELLALDGPSHGCMLVPREWFRQIGFVDESISAYADWDTCISLSKLFDFTTVNQPCVNYFQDDPNSLQKNKIRAALDYVYVVEKHRNDMLQFIGRSGLAWHYRIAAFLFDAAGEFSRCKAYMLKAFKMDDKNAVTFLLALSTMFGERTYHLTRQLGTKAYNRLIFKESRFSAT